MSDTIISSELRHLVRERAKGICEYCLIDESDTLLGCQVTHIISIEEGGQTTPDNLAYICAVCNRAKGNERGTTDWDTWEFTQYFNPRLDKWGDHFVFDNNCVSPFSAIGRVTYDIISNANRFVERYELVAAGRYPPPQALSLMD